MGHGGRLGGLLLLLWCGWRDSEERVLLVATSLVSWQKMGLLALLWVDLEQSSAASYKLKKPLYQYVTI